MAKKMAKKRVEFIDFNKKFNISLFSNKSKNNFSLFINEFNDKCNFIYDKKLINNLSKFKSIIIKNNEITFEGQKLKTLPISQIIALNTNNFFFSMTLNKKNEWNISYSKKFTKNFKNFSTIKLI